MDSQSAENLEVPLSLLGCNHRWRLWNLITPDFRQRTKNFDGTWADSDDQQVLGPLQFQYWHVRSHYKEISTVLVYVGSVKSGGNGRRIVYVARCGHHG